MEKNCQNTGLMTTPMQIWVIERILRGEGGILTRNYRIWNFSSSWATFSSVENAEAAKKKNHKLVDVLQ